MCDHQADPVSRFRYIDERHIRKIQSPEDVPELSEDDFLARKTVVRQVSKWSADNRGMPEVIYRNEWAPNLYQN
jgi:hypothetical protein